MSMLDEKLIEELDEKYSLYQGFFTDLMEVKDFVDIMQWFHIDGVYLVTREDAEFCGIRANNFCVKIGHKDGSGEHESADLFILVEGNHKGCLAIDVIRVPYGNLRYSL